MIKILISPAFVALLYCLSITPAFAATPTLGAVIPHHGATEPNIPRTFTVTYADRDGWTNLKETYLLISASTTALSNSVHLYYDQNANLLYLRDDTNTSWLGGFAPASANTIQNSQVTLNCALSSVSGSSSALTVKFNLTFKPKYSGKIYNTYLKATDDTDLSVGFTKKGKYTVTYKPTADAISPSSGISQPDQYITFTTTFSDQDGWTNIQQARFLVNSSLIYSNCLNGYYNQNTNRLYLRNDANTSWLGGFTPGSNNVIENSYCRLDISKTTIFGSSSTLALNWSVSFKSSFTGTKNTYLYVRDDAKANSRWKQKGDWLVDAIPPAGSIRINNDTQYTNQISVGLNLSAQDEPGGSGIFQMQFSNDNIIWSTPEPYTTTKDWILQKPDGQKIVYVKFSDTAGNWSQAFSDTIILDTTAPLIIITSPIDGAIVEDILIQFEGSIDGIPFSETRTLLEGENVLTKFAADNAGNTGSASVTVYLYLGQIIGPEGGEVTSFDGLVKVVIPQDALNEPSQISVLTLNKDVLQSAIPFGTSLLTVAECKPHGLIFNKPVSIVYTLDQAEIPGTPVELGLYDSSTGKIIQTGQSSTIPSDGYTVTFSITHFSIYAVLKNLIPQSAPIGPGVKIPLPDMLTGTFSHTFPITIPPGRKGLQPALSLTYRSSNPNSWVGQGFSLNPGYIIRSTRLGPPTYIDTQDTFYLVTDAGTTELVWLTDNLYQAKIESSFTKFFKEQDGAWKAVAKDGSILRFGQTTDSRENAPSGTFSWYLTRAVDTNGNYIEYIYTKDAGKTYPSRINYTGNEIGISPTNQVEFFLETRDDVGSSYISTSKIVTAKRLKEIQVKVNNALVWRYSIEYTQSPDTGISLISAITQYGADGTSLPAQRFSYQKAR